MSIEIKAMTADELFGLNDDLRHELIDGELTTMSPSGFEHGDIAGELLERLRPFVREHGLGRVVGTDVGFLLSRNPDTVLAPDVAFVAQARIPQGAAVKKFFAGAPDLAIEVVSPSDTWQEIARKVDLYLSAGTRLVWVVNPGQKSVTVYQPDGQTLLRREGDQLLGDGVLPDFQLRVAELFQ